MSSSSTAPRIGHGQGGDDKLGRAERIIRDHWPDIGPFVSVYKDIHQHPELCGLESRTAAAVASQLRRIGGLQVVTSIGGHGLAGVLRNGPGKTILLRAELDAQPIAEDTGLPYASVAGNKDAAGREQQPAMHACGHDIHIACVLATMQLLRSAAREWSGTVLAVFQSGKEIPTGAEAMTNAGLYRRCPVPDIMLAQQVGIAKAGMVAVGTGPVLPSSHLLSLAIASSGPGLNPRERPDPLNIASYLMTRFQAMMGSEIDRREYSALVCRDVEVDKSGGQFANRVVLHLEIKSCDAAATRDQIYSGIRAIAKAECGVASALSVGRAEFATEWMPRAPRVRNDDGLAETLQACFRRHFGARFRAQPPMDTAADDLALLGGPDPVPFVYWKLGSTDPAAWDAAVAKGGDILEHVPATYSPKFAPAPEPTVATGTEAMALATLVFL